MTWRGLPAGMDLSWEVLRNSCRTFRVARFRCSGLMRVASSLRWLVSIESDSDFRAASGVEYADTWPATGDAILNALPMSGFTAVIVGIITVEVAIVVGELLQMRREKMKARANEFEAKYKESEARAEKLAAENADLRQRLEDTKQ